MFSPSLLWSAPEINPINRKARSIPVLNPLSIYGRVFFFSWFGFLIAFWSWYAFPPLLNDVIAADLSIGKNEIANSNIIALVATLLVRLVAGPCCDRFGPRYTFAGTLLIGAIPTFLAGTAYNVSELYALRFFIGILGGSFVPCQVWTTAFFDKNVVGTANALTAGLGNSGGGITYFVMPAVFLSLVGDGLTPHVAWRVAFIVPGILITVTAILLILLCPDTPTGKWSERTQAAENNLRKHHVSGTIVDIPTAPADDGEAEKQAGAEPGSIADEKEKMDANAAAGNSSSSEHEVQMGEQEMLDIANGEVIQKPSTKEILRVLASPSTLVLGACYFCSFGAELSINSILGTYIGTNFPTFGLKESGSWAAMFGLMNIVFRPLGGVVSDFAFRTTKSLWAKKALLHGYGLLMGAFFVAVGVTDPKRLGEFVGLLNVGAAFFMEGGNGMNFSLVPHVHPYANGVVSGFTGAMGNFGGVIFAIIFRYVGDYGRSVWIIGVIGMCVNLLVSWIPPIPKGQVGGR